MRRALIAPVAAIAVAGGLLALAQVEPSPGGTLAKVRTGGTFRVSFVGVDHVDPALSYSITGWTLLDTTCARLMAYPDRPPPHAFRVVPEVAAGPPKVSRDLKTYTFTLRRDFRFSNGRPVTAEAFSRAIHRTLDPAMESPGAQYTRDIAGAAAVLAGRARSAKGVIARRDRLVIRLTRPVPDLPARLTMPFFCAVPPSLPTNPEGVGAFPAAGPYFIADYRRGERVVLRRNRFYRGERPRRIDMFVVDLRARSDNEILNRVERGEADWGFAPPPAYFDPQRDLVRKYGVNRSRFFVTPGLTLRSFVFNTTRPLFRQARLRRAVNFAVDRAEIRRIAAGNAGALAARLTDQHLPPIIAGYRDARIYPLARPDVRRARALARGRTRGGKAVMYAIGAPLPLAHAQSLKRDLAAIGLDLEITAIPGPAFFSRLTAPGAAWDIAGSGWAPDYVDPYAYLNVLLDPRFAPPNGGNLGRFASPAFTRKLRQAARLRGRTRYRGYGRLDVELAREAAPLIPISYTNEYTLVSARVDPRCVVLRPFLDLTAVCLKR